MPKLPRISAQKALAALQKLGFVQVRQKGSHVILKLETSEKTVGCVIPMHHELAAGTLRGILRQAHVTVEKFIEVL